ncbi:GNAT family N-acetyltransferase [Rhizobium alvei]|uniref:GNAT family N-acetyltransferase n=1 Tax=Rhizobium alvei TaxID=1132659 RepID=A0ABT8YHA6_9HYPH|nr:GNAT family N-acetyltransferase [Rhizobium alvei]MDO6963057.1 GNAT family N-acetyltransferase [Rhizobium alvei]
MTFFVRSASESDLARVSDLLRATWHATYDSIYGAEKVEALTKAWHSVAALSAKLARPHSEFVVADDGRRIGGMAYASMSATEKKTAMLHQLYVHPDLQGQGIGRDLFAEVETCFPDAERMKLEVSPENAKAIRFYEGLGFAEVGRTENCAADQSGLPALIFEKTLAF